MIRSSSSRSLAVVTSLFAVAFMLGCDGTPTDVLTDAPGPNLHHRPGHGGGGGGGGGGDGDDGGSGGSELYTYTHDGDLTTDPETADAIKNVGKGKEADDVVMSGAGDDDKLLLSGPLLAANGLDACFPPNRDTDDDGLPDAHSADFAGDIEPTGEGTTESSYFLSGFASDGTSPIDYRLVVEGTHDGSPAFPPAVGETVSIGFVAAVLETRGKSKGACGGPIAITGGVDVTGTS